MKKITREMVDSLEWSEQDLSHMIFNISNCLGGENTKYNIVGDEVDCDGYIHWYDSDGDLIPSNYKVPEWAEKRTVYKPELLSREDFTAMVMTHCDVVLVYAVDGTDEMVVGTADQIESILEENSKRLYEDSAYDSWDEKYYPISLDEARDKVWSCASICTQEDYLKSQFDAEQE